MGEGTKVSRGSSRPGLTVRCWSVVSHESSAGDSMAAWFFLVAFLEIALLLEGVVAAAAVVLAVVLVLVLGGVVGGVVSVDVGGDGGVDVFAVVVIVD